MVRRNIFDLIVGRNGFWAIKVTFVLEVLRGCGFGFFLEKTKFG